MKTRQEILQNMHEEILSGKDLDITSLLLQHCMLEVLLDIRDGLYTIKNALIDIGLNLEKQH